MTTEQIEANAGYFAAAQSILDLYRDHDGVAVDAADENRLRVCWPMAMHALNEVMAALHLVDAGLLYPAVVNARVAYEHAVVAQWVRTTDDGPENLRATIQKGQRSMLSAIGAWAELPADLKRDATAAIADPFLPAFWEICDEFDGKSKQLYTIYRSLSGAVHPSFETIGRHLGLQENPDRPPLHASSSRGDMPSDLPFALAWAAVLAAHTLESLRRGQPRLHEVVVIAEQNHLVADLASARRRAADTKAT